MAGVKIINTGAREDNLDTIKQGLQETKIGASDLNGSLNWLIWLKILPFIGNYYTDAKHLTKAMSYELQASEEIVRILEPQKVELGFTGVPTPGQDKLAQAVKILEQLVPNLDKIEPSLRKARDEVANINTDKYPEKVGKYKVKGYLKIAKDFISGAHSLVTDGRETLEVAPSALGHPTPKTYLLIFQNDKEIRATGGFMTAYAFLKFDKGRISSTSSDDIYRLDEKLLNVCLSKICPLTPPQPIIKYLPEVSGKPRSAWSMRDSNISPDLPTSMKEFERMYKLLGEGLPFDGIITIDTKVVEEIIKITGPIDVFGTKYSSDQDDRCDCPNVIYELERYSQIIEKGEADRKAILGVLMQQLLAKSLGASTDKVPDFINTGVKLANEKHIIFYMHDPKTQSALSNINWTGQIKEYDGDYLHINDSNFAGGKTNLYIEEKVELNSQIDSNGNVINKLTIEYKNPKPFSAWLNTIYRDYVRIYVPKGSTLINSKGSDEEMTSLDDELLNKTYFEAFITVRPTNSRVLSFEYNSAKKMEGMEYKLLIQKQPGAKDYPFTIKINGKSQDKFNLSTDKMISKKI